MCRGCPIGIVSGWSQEGYTIADHWNQVGLDNLIAWHSRSTHVKNKEKVAAWIEIFIQQREGELP